MTLCALCRNLILKAWDTVDVLVIGNYERLCPDLSFADFAVEAGVVPLSTLVLNLLRPAHKRLFTSLAL
jgi:hypothetical protein